MLRTFFSSSVQQRQRRRPPLTTESELNVFCTNPLSLRTDRQPRSDAVNYVRSSISKFMHRGGKRKTWCPSVTSASGVVAVGLTTSRSLDVVGHGCSVPRDVFFHSSKSAYGEQEMHNSGCSGSAAMLSGSPLSVIDEENDNKCHEDGGIANGVVFQTSIFLDDGEDINTFSEQIEEGVEDEGAQYDVVQVEGNIQRGTPMERIMEAWVEGAAMVENELVTADDATEETEVKSLGGSSQVASLSSSEKKDLARNSLLSSISHDSPTTLDDSENRHSDNQGPGHTIPEDHYRIVDSAAVENILRWIDQMNWMDQPINVGVEVSFERSDIIQRVENDLNEGSIDKIENDRVRGFVRAKKRGVSRDMMKSNKMGSNVVSQDITPAPSFPLRSKPYESVLSTLAAYSLNLRLCHRNYDETPAVRRLLSHVDEGAASIFRRRCMTDNGHSVKFYNSYIRCLTYRGGNSSEDLSSGGKRAEAVLKNMLSANGIRLMDDSIVCSGSSSAGGGSISGRSSIAGALKQTSTFVPLPNVDTFHAVMEHFAVASKGGALKCQQLYDALVKYHRFANEEFEPQSGLKNMIDTRPNTETFRLMFVAMANSNDSDWRFDFQRARKMMDQLHEWNADTGDKVHVMTEGTFHMSAEYWIDVYNAPLRHSGPQARKMKDKDTASRMQLCRNHKSPWQFQCSNGKQFTRATAKEAEEMELWLRWMESQSAENDGDAVFIPPPPNVETYESVIQAWVRTGTLRGLLRAEEWLTRLVAVHRRYQSNNAHDVDEEDEDFLFSKPPRSCWCEPRLSTFHPVIGAWLHTNFTYRSLCVEGWIEKLVEWSSESGIGAEGWKKNANEETTKSHLADEIDRTHLSSFERRNSGELLQPALIPMCKPDERTMSAAVMSWWSQLDRTIKHIQKERNVVSSSSFSPPFSARRCIEWVDKICSLEREGYFSNGQIFDDVGFHCAMFLFAIDAIGKMCVVYGNMSKRVRSDSSVWGMENIVRIVAYYDNLLFRSQGGGVVEHRAQVFEESGTAPPRRLRELILGLPLVYTQVVSTTRALTRTTDWSTHADRFVFPVERILKNAAEFYPFLMEERRRQFELSGGEWDGGQGKEKAHRSVSDLFPINEFDVGVFSSDGYRYDIGLNTRLYKTASEGAPENAKHTYHQLFMEILKHCKRLTESTNFSGDAARIVTSMLFTIGASNSPLREKHADLTELFEEMIVCVTLMPCRQAEQFDILERIYRLAASSSNSNNKSLLVAIQKSLQGVRSLEKDVFLERLYKVS